MKSHPAILPSLLSFIALVSLSGCGRVIDWGKSHFGQGQVVEQCKKTPRSYIQSALVYDEFTTVCMVDALWLSDEVRLAYAQAHALKSGKDTEFRHMFLRRQLEENKHFITFYLVVEPDLKLDEKDSAWSLFLKVGDDAIIPSEVKSVELVPEYKNFFGTRYNRFKSVYKVVFDAVDANEKEILHPAITKLSLCIRSTDKEAVLSWIIRPEDELLEQRKMCA